MEWPACRPAHRSTDFTASLAIDSFPLLVSSLAVPARKQAGVAQLVEQLICNHQVGGSSPFTGSNKINNLEESTPAKNNRCSKNCSKYFPSGSIIRAVSHLLPI